MSIRFKNSSMLLVVSLLHFFACAQTNSVVRKIHAFYTVRLPGNIAVNERGEPLHDGIDTVTTIYLETSTKRITWDTAWLYGKTYLVIVQPVIQFPFEAGITKQTHKKILLTPAKGNYLWRLDLSPIEKRFKSPGPYQLILRGKYKGKIITRKTDFIIELEGIPSV